MQLHKKIKSLRRSKGWSQEQVAERLSMSTSAYGSIERGETDVNFSRLEQLAEIFQIDLSSLLDKGVTFNFTGTDNTDCCHNWHINSPSDESEKLLHQLKEKDLLIAQKDVEIEYLKQQNADLREMIAFLKNK
ncbi:MAG: hypothetical protein BWK79_18650 [Beggiatoa sp. IS2]|nr:MAG: hypothetical protein BWK79_18650 [Beggiatoa sp. IS2]